MTEAASFLFRRAQAPLFLIGLGHSATHWVGTTFMILLPFMGKDLGLSYTAVGLLVSLRHVSSVVTNVGAGAAVDLMGRPLRFLLVTLIINTVAIALLGATDLYWVIAAMAMLIGASNNMWHPAAMSYLSAAYAPRRGLALSIHATGASLGDMLAPLAAGALLVVFTWRQTAGVIAVPGAMILVLFWLFLLPREEAPPARREGEEEGGRPGYVQGLAFLVRQRAFLGLCLMAGTRSMVQSGLFLFLPLYLADVLGANPVVLGTAMMAMHLGGALVSPISGAYSDHVGPKPVLAFGLLAATLVIATLPAVQNLTLFVATVGLLGVVFYAVRPIVQSWAMDLSPPEMRGTAVSMLFGTQSSLAAVVPVVTGMVADRWGIPVVFYVLAGLMALSTLTVLLLPQRVARAET